MIRERRPWLWILIGVLFVVAVGLSWYGFRELKRASAPAPEQLQDLDAKVQALEARVDSLQAESFGSSAVKALLYILSFGIPGFLTFYWLRQKYKRTTVYMTQEQFREKAKELLKKDYSFDAVRIRSFRYERQPNLPGIYFAECSQVPHGVEGLTYMNRWVWSWETDWNKRGVTEPGLTEEQVIDNFHKSEIKGFGPQKPEKSLFDEKEKVEVLRQTESALEDLGFREPGGTG